MARIATKLRIRIKKPHTTQQAIIDQARRFSVVCLGRRSGKTVLATNRLIDMALKGKPCAYFAPSYRMMSDVWRETKYILYPVIKRVNEQEKRIETITGGLIDFWSLDTPDAARGKKYARVIIDEAAMVRGLMDAWNKVIRPTLADFQGDAWFLSTPKGLNDFFRLYQRGQDDPEWQRWQMPTSCNPFIPASEIDAMRAGLPERVYRQEILAEFIEDGSYFQGIDRAAVIAQPDDPGRHAGHYLVAGVDWGLSSDFTVVAVACRECNRVVDWDRFTQLDFTYQRERLLSLARRWNLAGVLPERNSFGAPNIELIREHVSVLSGPDDKPGFNTSATTKPGLIQALATALEHDGFQVPTLAADELRSYEVETMASGHPQFSAPPGFHDDWVIALALAWRAVRTLPPQIEVTENLFYA